MPLSTGSPLGQVGVGPDPDPDDHQVGGQPGAVGQHHRLDAVAAFDPLGPRPGADVHAPVPQEGLEEAAHLRADGPGPDGVAPLEEGHPGVHLGGAGGHLGPDEAAAKDDHALGPGDGGPQPLGVVDRAQVVDALQVPAGQLQADRLGAGGQHQAGAVAELVADLGGDGPGGRVQGARPGRQQQLDLVVAVPGLVVGAGLVAPGLAAEELLGQRRPLVGELRLGGQHHGRALAAGRSDPLGRLGGGDPAADDHELHVADGHGTTSGGQGLGSEA
jgi:hypothetical protein